MGWCMFFIFFIRFISLSRSLMRCMSSMVCEFHLKCISTSIIMTTLLGMVYICAFCCLIMARKGRQG